MKINEDMNKIINLELTLKSINQIIKNTFIRKEKKLWITSL